MWLERKYTSLLSSRLERFTLRGNVASFRCPVCGDSKISKYKTRGTIVLKPTGAFFYCHNCHLPMKFGDFLKFVDPLIFDDYLKEVLAEKYADKAKPATIDDSKFETKPEFKRVDDKLKQLRKVSQLPHSHPVRGVVDKRLIPPSQHHRLYYAPKFKEWTNSIIPGKFDNLDHDEPRLIIPFLDQDGVFYGFQGRSFRKKTNLRYITIMIDEDKSKVFGLDQVDFSKPVKVVEGPIDSLFVKNSLASAGGKIHKEMEKLEVDRSNTTVIYDNEPRNHHNVVNIQEASEMGYPVVIWPEDNQLKDVNDMVLHGEIPDIDAYLEAHTYSTLRAKLELQKWRKS